MSPSDLVDRFVAILLRTHGGTRRRWRAVVGQPRVYDVATHPHCNWSITPTGNAAEVEVVETLADRLRGEHPIIAG